MNIGKISNNARGQRLLISMGNGIMTRYVYDTRNFRLLRMKSEDYVLTTTSTTDTYTPQSGTTIQDFAYTYDALGNILNINDATPDAGAGGIGDLSRDFDYDALYRLLYATGRENQPTSTNPVSWSVAHRPPITYALTPVQKADLKLSSIKNQ